jgi:hypothetical protein
MRKLSLSVSYTVERPGKTRNSSFSVNPHSSAPRYVKTVGNHVPPTVSNRIGAGHTHEECWNTLEKARPQRTQFIT